jgi:hypothetical protein
VHRICVSKTPRTSQAMMRAVGTSSKAITSRRWRQGYDSIHDLRGSRGGANLGRVGGVHEQRKSEREGD